MALLDTPLNKAGRLRIFMTTKKGSVIKISPTIRLPRTYKRFSGLMVDLLTKMKIKSSENHEVLMEIVNGKIEEHIPQNSYKVGTSTRGHLVTDLE